MEEEIKYTDFLIDCTNPELFNRTVMQMGGVLCNDYKGVYLKQEGYYIMRVLGNPGFIKFAIEHQGYGKIIRQLEEPA